MASLTSYPTDTNLFQKPSDPWFIDGEESVLAAAKLRNVQKRLSAYNAKEVISSTINSLARQVVRFDSSVRVSVSYDEEDNQFEFVAQSDATGKRLDIIVGVDFVQPIQLSLEGAYVGAKARRPYDAQSLIHWLFSDSKGFVLS